MARRRALPGSRHGGVRPAGGRDRGAREGQDPDLGGRERARRGLGVRGHARGVRGHAERRVRRDQGERAGRPGGARRPAAAGPDGVARARARHARGGRDPQVRHRQRAPPRAGRAGGEPLRRVPRLARRAWLLGSAVGHGARLSRRPGLPGRPELHGRGRGPGRLPHAVTGGAGRGGRRAALRDAARQPRGPSMRARASFTSTAGPTRRPRAVPRSTRSGGSPRAGTR